MKSSNNKKPKYGNWVSDKLIAKVLAMFLVFSLLAAALFVAAPQWGAFTVVLAVMFIVLAAFFLVGFTYFLKARHLFSYSGGGVQQKILDLVVSRTRWDGNGRVLDIGCGSGALAIVLAKKYKDARITGIDYWGGSWGYYQKQCETNAEIEGVGGSIVFLRASASSIPFPDETFDLAVSNLVFHEVKDSNDKRAVIGEALRVVKKGGCFVFQDLLQIEQYFGKIDDLIASLKESGVQEVYFEDTSNSPFIPGLLKLPFMVGTLGMLYGVK